MPGSSACVIFLYSKLSALRPGNDRRAVLATLEQVVAGGEVQLSAVGLAAVTFEALGFEDDRGGGEGGRLGRARSGVCIATSIAAMQRPERKMLRDSNMPLYQPTADRSLLAHCIQD
jgi:hypothetical protein